MLIELHQPRGNPRISAERFPNTLVVTTLNGGVTLKRKPPGGAAILEDPDYRSVVQGQDIDAYRLSPNRRPGINDTPTFQDPTESGWEYAVRTQEKDGTSSYTMLTLVREHDTEGNTKGWVVWFEVVVNNHLTLALPAFDRMDRTAIVINPHYQIPVEQPPSAWERIAEDP